MSMNTSTKFFHWRHWLIASALALGGASPALAQLSVKDQGLATQAGTWFSYEKLAVLPAAGTPLDLQLISLTRQGSAVTIHEGLSLARVYHFTKPLGVNGLVRVRYESAELGNHDPNALFLFVQAADGQRFKPLMNSTPHPGNGYVEATLADRPVKAITLADPGALGYVYAPQVADVSQLTDRSFVLTWPQVLGAESYQLDVSTRADFSALVPGYQNLAVSGATAPVSGLQPGNRYYFRIRSVDEDNQTQQSPVGEAQTLTFVASIARNAATPTNATALSYTVTFASPVTGVDAADFALTTTGTATANIGTPAGSGAVWIVPVSGVSGQGTLRLDFVGLTGIQPHAIQAFTSGESYAVDHVAPVARTKDIQVVLGADGTVTITPQQVDNGSTDNGGPVSLSLDRTTFTRAQTGKHTVTLTVTDAVGNASTATATVDVARDVDRIVPVPDVQTTYGTTAAQLVLPEQMEVVFTDGTRQSVAITWDRSNYSSNVGSYLLTGTVVLTGHTSNSQAVRPTVRVNVGQAPQQISFTQLGTVNRDAGTVSLQVSSNSALPVTLSVDDDQVATVTGTTLNVLRLGTVRITATQAGDGNYLAAEPVTITVVVKDPSADLPVRVHQVVSPNGDDINDFLMIEGIRDYPDNKVTIFNRNGTLVYEVSGYDNGNRAFRGVSTGELKVPAGTYFYIIEVRENGQWKHKKGYFILRYTADGR